MQFIKHIHKILSGFLLLITLISFSGFSPVTANSHSAQTELLFTKNITDNDTVNYLNISRYCPKKTIFNQYIVFNFKCFLNTFDFDLTFRFKSQKTIELLFTNYNILEQNLIAQTFSGDPEPAFIK
ncbi:hypothetical protein Q4Q35_15565 [Flavivirga aquimarina]|uniref:Uncharacterized protein n=1 Tax=Flavivirga aquimarina TaxID=2027862 RepID=A0ABT8WDM6_9FLAO|nr:hypothetical protein [Flavivirga aquimarina]MDO5971225.1 hypothetical protein [Flavivirga aquimarina]